MTDTTIPKTAPLPHQLEAIDFIVNHPIAALLDEQGVGKTKEVIDAMIALLAGKKIESVLIVCPKTLMNTWNTEIKKHSYLVPTVIEGPATQKIYHLLSAPNIYIINYEGLISEERLITLLLRTKSFAIVLDESQRIKNPDTRTYQSISRLRKLAPRRYILSGTMVANSPVDLWSQFFFLDGGTVLGTSFKEYKRKYNSARLSKDDLVELREKIRPLSIRRLKNDVLELPEKIFVTREVDMSPRQKEIYKRLKEELLIEIFSEGDNQIIDESKTILKKLLRLVQVASNPGLIVKDYEETPAKFIELSKIVEEVISRGEKVIIWSSFVDNVKELHKKYSQHGALAIHGSIKIADRNRYIKLFQEDPSHKILVANPAAAREGLTLTAANNAVYLDRSFNLVDYLQSQDRIHRISQEKTCHIIKLVAKDTIDIFIEDKLSLKQDVAKVIQGDSVDIDFDKFLTKEEIFSILN